MTNQRKQERRVRRENFLRDKINWRSGAYRALTIIGFYVCIFFAINLIVKIAKADGFGGGLTDFNGNGITSSSNGVAGSQLLHTQHADTTTSTTALGSLNASVSIAMAGLSSAGFQLNAGTLIGTIQAQSSVDGGTTWTNSQFYDNTNSAILPSVTFSSANIQKIYSILPLGGASNVRVTVSAYTSGSATGLLRASSVSASAGTVSVAAYGTVTLTYPNTIANNAVLVLAANPNRKYVMISSPNTSITCQLGTSAALSSTTGFTISTGTFYELKGDNLYTGAIYCIAATIKALSVTEGTP